MSAGTKVKLSSVVVKTIGGGTPERDKPEYWNGGTPWASVKDFKDGVYRITNTKEEISEKGLKRSASHLIPAGTPIICTRMAVGRIAKATVPVAINQDLRALFVRDEYDSDYVVSSIDSIRSQIDNLAIGSTVKGISIDQLLNFEIQELPKPEQTKIAGILSTVDRAIEQTEALIAKQQRIKTGLMQDLLTRGIDEHGNLRSEQTHKFKDSPLGRIPVEWEVKPLEECVEFWDGRRVPLKQEDREKIKGEFPYYGASGIIDHIDKFLFDDDLILLGEDGENVISRNLPLAFKVSGKIWVNNHAHVLKPKIGQDIDFLIDRLEFYDYSLLVSGSAQPKLNQRNLRQMKLPIPPFNEQQKIGGSIHAIKQDLAIRFGQITKLRSLKTALMQDLLTGRKRVTELLTFP